MLKWLIGLCAAIYVTLLAFGEPSSQELAARNARDALLIARSKPAAPAVPDLVEVAAPAAEPTPIPALQSIEAVALVSSPAQGTTTSAPAVVTSEPLTQTASAATAASSATPNAIRRITGKRVNLRSGPSTTNPIVGRALRDDSAEVIEVLPSGWAKVYILETGIEAYISAQFLAPAG